MAKLQPHFDSMCPVCSSRQVSTPEYQDIVEWIILRIARMHVLRCHACKRCFYLPHPKPDPYRQASARLELAQKRRFADLGRGRKGCNDFSPSIRT